MPYTAYEVVSVGGVRTAVPVLGAPSLPAVVRNPRDTAILGVDMPTPQLAGATGAPQTTWPSTATLTISAAATYSDLIFPCYISVATSAPVRFTNCTFLGPPVRTATSSRGIINCTNVLVADVVLTDCTIDPTDPSEFTDGIKGHHYTLKRCIIRNTCDAFGVFNNNAGPGGTSDRTFKDGPMAVVLEQSILGPLVYFAPDRTGDHSTDSPYPHSHNDICQHQIGGWGVRVAGCVINGQLNPNIGQASLPIGDATTPGNLHYPYLQAQTVLQWQQDAASTTLDAKHDWDSNWINGGAAVWNLTAAGRRAGQFINHNRRITHDQRPDTDRVIQASTGVTYTQTNNSYLDGSAIRT